MDAMIPSFRLRWVDKSSNSQIETRRVLQQYFTYAHKSGGLWVDVPDAGHISKARDSE